MRAKLVTFGITAAVAILALVLQASPQAIAQGNANKPARAPSRRAKPAPKPPAAAQPATSEPAMMAPAKPVAKKPRQAKKRPMAMKGVPMGVPNCLKHLSEMAAMDPLPAYEGHPDEIVNNGLMWNDPKSKCSVGSDENARKKIAEMAIAWRMKDAAKVRSLLAELESAAGPK